MADSGNYDRQFTWLRRSTSQDDTGEDVESWASNGTLWGSLKEMSASKQLAYGMQDSQATMEIRFRQFPTVDAKDRLQDLRFDQLLVIDGVMFSFGTNETVVYAYSLAGVYPS